MAFQDLQRLPLWEHVAESGRFAEYAVPSALQPWNLVGRLTLSCASLLGSVADVAQISTWGRITADSALSQASGHVAQPLDASVLADDEFSIDTAGAAMHF